MLKISLGWFYLLLLPELLVIQSQNSFAYNLAAFTCDSSCVADQTTGLIALYQATGVCFPPLCNRMITYHYLCSVVWRYNCGLSQSSNSCCVVCTYRGMRGHAVTTGALLFLTAAGLAYFAVKPMVPSRQQHYLIPAV